jgi:polar amino acid transport system substrate-binding protein
VTGWLRIGCINSEVPPLFHRHHRRRGRRGYEPAIAQLLAGRLGRHVEWCFVPWSALLPALQAGTVDAVLCGQAITPARQERVSFTRPCAIFHESVLVRAGDSITSPADLAGKRVAAIAGSTNMALAVTFGGIEAAPFDGACGDVFGDMLSALRAGAVDAVVDDEVVMAPLGNDPAFKVAFTVPTGNRWGVAVAKNRPDLLADLDGALEQAFADDSVEKAWREWLPRLAYPFAPAATSMLGCDA